MRLWVMIITIRKDGGAVPGPHRPGLLQRDSARRNLAFMYPTGRPTYNAYGVFRRKSVILVLYHQAVSGYDRVRGPSVIAFPGQAEHDFLPFKGELNRDHRIECIGPLGGLGDGLRTMEEMIVDRGILIGYDDLIVVPLGDALEPFVWWLRLATELCGAFIAEIEVVGPLAVGVLPFGCDDAAIPVAVQGPGYLVRVQTVLQDLGELAVPYRFVTVIVFEDGSGHQDATLGLFCHHGIHGDGCIKVELNHMVDAIRGNLPQVRMLADR